ncbi:nuclear transport factor 2 family protein [Streptomyces sp. NK15101]|uniref:nuclear transport factor 2 family protein n=1 Tax=Streptomyces sp. NK15101 TaxID=2873261 RepID=UPI001CED862F|nr:nuclear transport factor 2 family protein [Streptomyces sp. NK15101]
MDRSDVIDACTRMAWYADQWDRERLAGVFADKVTLDHTGLDGGEPVIPGPDRIVAGRQEALGGACRFDLDVLRRRLDGWRITGVVMAATWGDGNRALAP